MSFFIADAHAQAAGGAAPPGMDLIFLVLLFVVFYFLLIRPQMKRAKEHKNMVASLAKGDEVVTGGGLLGRVTKVGDHFVTLEIADGLEVKVQKQALGSVMPKGTMKSL
ncbi:MAG: preprotein translocase subunit YajC [Gammaproteobacteria bacterium]|nr:preprotein translocase subunit YajC [Gammaproteobacteria bacterium]